MRKSVVSILVAGTLLTGFLGAADTLATVDGVKITVEDFAPILQQNHITFDKLNTDQKKALVDQAIANILMEKAGKKEGLENTPDFKKQLEEVKKQLLANAWAQKFGKELEKTIKVSDSDVKKFYDENKSKIFENQDGEARNIVVKTEDEAKKIIDELNKTPKAKVQDKFVELANKDSIDPNTQNTHDGGYIKFQKNAVVPEFATAAFALKPGTYTKTAIKSPYGYHVIYLIKKGDPYTIPFDQAKDKIKDLLTKQKFQEAFAKKLDDLRKKAKVTIDDKDLK